MQISVIHVKNPETVRPRVALCKVMELWLMPMCRLGQNRLTAARDGTQRPLSTEIPLMAAITEMSGAYEAWQNAGAP
ncbi:hypothetical protein DQG13_21630 [Paenibacillus sp. YN15]|nr:hypothetical protein DQG13_21630 [Paenibacillus sp. YN15]